MHIHVRVTKKLTNVLLLVISQIIYTRYLRFREANANDLSFAVINGPRRKKTCLRGFANNKGADQPVHPRRLISAFVIKFSESIISRLATSEISIF